MREGRAAQNPILATVLRERGLWLLLLLVAIYFARPLVGGETFFFRDLMLVALPQREKLVDLVRSGGLPLWDPYLHGGQPFIGIATNLAFYPTAALYFVLPSLIAFNLEIALHFLLCAFFAYWLARVLGLSPAASVLSGGAATFCGFTLSLGNLFNRLLAMPHSFAFLLFLHLFLLRRKARWLVAAAATGALMILAGSLEFFALTLAVAIAWVVSYPFPVRIAGRLAAWAGAAALAAGFSALQIVPSFAILSQSVRGSGLDFLAVASWSLHPRRLPEMLVPSFMGPTGDAREAAYWGSAFEDYGYPLFVSVYFGAPLILLALFEATVRPDSRLPSRFRRTLAAAAVIAVLLALGRFLLFSPRLYRIAPFLSAFRYPAKAIQAAVLPIALLAGAGADRLRSDNGADEGAAHRRRMGAFALGLAAALAVFGLALLSSPGDSGRLEQLLFRRRLDPDQTRALARHVVHAIVASGSVGAILMASHHRAKSRWRSSVGWMTALVLLDLSIAGLPVNLYAPRNLFTREPPLVGLVRRHLGDGRLFRDQNPAEMGLRSRTADLLSVYRWRRETLDVFLANAFRIPIVFHIDYDSLASRRVVRLTSLIQKLSWEQRVPLLSAGGVSAVLTSDRAAAPPLEQVVEVPNASDVPLLLYRNPGYPAAARFVSATASVASETDALRGILSRGFDPRRHAVVESPARGRTSSCGSAPVTEVRRGPSSWTGRVAAPCAGFVVFTSAYYPGWDARLDGSPSSVVRANFAFSGVPVPRGSHTISLEYRPISVPIGMAISAVFVAGSVTAALLNRRRRA